MANLPATDESMVAAKWYRRLTEAQQHWFRIFATHVPWVLWSEPVLLTTSDSGATYDLPSAGIMGVRLRDGRSGTLLTGGQDWMDDVDYIVTGSKIRFPGGRTRTFAQGPYAHYIAPPGDLTAAIEPTLLPEDARVLLVYHACQLWASQGGLRDPNFYSALEQKAAWGDPASPGHIGIIPALKRSYFGSGVTAASASPNSYTWPFGGVAW